MAKKIFSKRTLAMVLVLVMCFSMFQMTAQAAPSQNNWSYAYYLGQEYLGNAAGAAVKPDPVGYGFQGVITQLTFTDDSGIDWTFKWSAEANGEWRITGSQVSREKASAFPKVTADKIYVGYCGNKAYTFTLSQDGSAESWTYVNDSSRHANWFYYIRFIREYTVNVFYQNETGSVRYNGVTYAAQTPLVRYFQFLYPNGNIIDDSEYEDGEYTDPVTLLPKDYLGQDLISQGYEIKYATDAAGKDVLVSGVTISLLGENVLNVYCTLIPKKTEDYTVIHAYYTDGELDGTEKGKTIEVPENADFAEIVNELEKDTEYGGNEYTYDRYEVDPEDKTIILVYERETPPAEPTKYSVTYVYKGTVPAGAPAVPGAASYEEGTAVKVAQAPTLKNYTFSGWDKTDFTMPAEDVVIRGSWSENAKYDYSVIYNENYGTDPETKADSENVTATYAATHTIGVDANEFTRANYTFIGWAETSDGEVVYQAGDSIIFTEGGSKTLYAKWIEHDKYSYTVIYNGNGGTLSGGEQAYGDSENVSETYATSHTVGVDRNSFILENYTFTGWNTQADGKGTSYAAGDEIALTAQNNTCTLYAQWIEKDKYDYALTYNANFGANPQTSADEENISDTYATLHPITVNDSMFTRVNHTFIGWNTKADGSGVSYAEGDRISLNARVNTAILYAQWQENPKYDYAVTYNANFGDDPAVNADSENISGIYATSHSISVDSNRFVRPDYTFIGWNTKADGTGIAYKAGEVIALTAQNNTEILYAQWQENPKYSYSVQYNENYGTHPAVYRDSESVSNIYATGYSISVDHNRFVRPNYTFVGWNTAVDGTGTAYKAGEVIALTAENNTEILYAQWQENPKYDYAVIYHANFGADETKRDSQNVTGTYANPYTIDVDRNSFVRPNHTFIGWAEEPQGQVVYQSGDSILFTDSGSKTLYAKWIEHNKYSFTLIYNGNGGALADGHTAYGDSENAEGIYDNHLEISVDENTFTREGYTFLGWNTAADGTGIPCAAEDVIVFTALHNTMTLYAQWQEIPKYDYAVTYNANFGDEPATRADDQNVEGVYSEALNFSVDTEEFTREGYTFTGWNTEADGSGKAYAAGDVIALTAQENTEILYAQWSINEYEYTVHYVVRLDANPYAAFQGQLPENAPQGGKAVHGAVINETTLQLPKAITDGTYTYDYTGIDGIVIPFGTNTVIVYYSAVTPVVEIPEEEIPLVQPPADQPAPVNPGSEPAPAPSAPAAPSIPGAPLVDLPDEEVPLADAPKTGDAMTLYMGLTALSGMGLLGLGLTKKKEENEEN